MLYILRCCHGKINKLLCKQHDWLQQFAHLLILVQKQLQKTFILFQRVCTCEMK